MTAAANLQSRYDAIAAILAAGQTPDGQSLNKINVSIEGEVIPTNEYVDRLYREMAQLRAEMESAAAAGGAVPTVVSRVLPR